MKTANHGRKAMMTKTYAEKSMALFIGLSLLLTVVSFGNSTDQKVNNMLWNTTLDSFSLVRSMPSGLKGDSLMVVSTDKNNWFARLESVLPNRIDADTALRGEESGASDHKPKRRKLAFLLKAGSASITAEGYGSSFTYGLGLHMQLSKTIGLEITLDRYSVPVSKNFEGMGLGKLQVTPLLLNGQWRFPLGRFVPYASAGAGFYFIHFEPDPEAELSAAQDLVYTDRFALHLGGGVDVQIMSSLDFCAELRYSLIKTWIQSRDEAHVEPADQDIFNLNTLVLSLGLKYYF